ncbi:MAG: chemotaxis-specific protein-glutamate methyltransferase CheB [Sulfuricella sp.]|nr:chemotaxis-specific protein-glutamate methyltransferase CheB [Sulfuricella sp.]
MTSPPIPHSAFRNPHSNAPQSPIRVLLVDDSPIALVIIKRILAASPDIQVVGTAANGREALEMIPRLQPGVICTDLHMPLLDGLEFTKAVMAQYPRPILALSVSLQKEQTHNIFKLLEAGAIDVMAKPRGGLEASAGLDAQELISKIKILSGVIVIRRRRNGSSAECGLQNAELKPEPLAGELPIPQSAIRNPQLRTRILGIGASTGGPQALQAILSQLPASLPVPVLCVQHISEGFMQGLVDWLAEQCPMRIRTAETGVVPEPGTVYFPRDNTHLKIGGDGKLICSAEPACNGHRPSISVAFASLAQHYGSASACVLLTGMGRDGVDGMHAVRRAGGVTIAQDEDSSIVFGMPRQAIEEGAARHVLPLDKIASALVRLTNADFGMQIAE